MSHYYGSTYDRNNLGPKFNRETFGAKVTPGTTHVITIPGTSYLCMLGDALMTPPPPVPGKWSDVSGEWLQGPETVKPAKVVALMAALTRSTVTGPGKRRPKAAPVLQTVAEYLDTLTLTTNRTAA